MAQSSGGPVDQKVTAATVAAALVSTALAWLTTKGLDAPAGLEIPLVGALTALFTYIAGYLQRTSVKVLRERLWSHRDYDLTRNADNSLRNEGLGGTL